MKYFEKCKSIPVIINAIPIANVFLKNDANVSLNVKPMIAVKIQPKIMYRDNFPYSDLKSNVKNAFSVNFISFQKTMKITRSVPRCKRMS